MWLTVRWQKVMVNFAASWEISQPNAANRPALVSGFGQSERSGQSE